MKLFIVSGLSGSGKSICLKVLEDFGCYCIDNLPANLLPQVIEPLKDMYERLAVSIDIRNSEKSLSMIPKMLQSLKSKNIECQLIYLDAQDEVIIQRYNHSHRPHPLKKQFSTLTKAIRAEREYLQTLAQIADMMIDTTDLHPQEFREQLQQQCSMENEKIALLFLSFGYKYGIPTDMDMILDVRCLPNPYWQSELAALTGRDAAVQAYLSQFPQSAQLGEQIANFTKNMLQHFQQTSRRYLQIGIGCTGGQHRSVYIVEQMPRYFENQEVPILLRHRELNT